VGKANVTDIDLVVLFHMAVTIGHLVFDFLLAESDFE
jgi:hypothetical protein